MDRNELVGQAVLYGGSLTACSAAPAAIADTSTVLLIFSGLGALAAVIGLAYTVWNGNRNFKLAREQFELRRQELLNGEASKPTR